MSTLVFVPYQDIYDFSKTEIMTREYSMLLILMKMLHQPRLVCIGKPRTIIDKCDLSFTDFPDNSNELQVKNIIMSAIKIRLVKPFSLDMILHRRGWWPNGYIRTLNLLTKLDFEDKIIVYSNNPFSWPVINYFSNKGATIFFDMMDNFAIHPSLNNFEKKIAYKGYSHSFSKASFICCNSEQSKKYCANHFGINVSLIKNGVFHVSNDDILLNNSFKSKLTYIKRKYVRIVGYVGKIGLRIDEQLLKDVMGRCLDTAFVFVGPEMSTQKNKNLSNVFCQYSNAFQVGAIPSSDVLSVIKAFDVLMIPHSVGIKENGGDPLKLYQYLSSGKPIITTGILGVDEFSKIIKISNSAEEWVRYINCNQYLFHGNYMIPKSIYWENRIQPLKKFIEGTINENLF